MSPDYRSSQRQLGFQVAPVFPPVSGYRLHGGISADREEHLMGEIRLKRFILGTAVLFGFAGLLVAGAGDPPPAPVVMSAPPPIADAGPPVLSSSPRIS